MPFSTEADALRSHKTSLGAPLKASKDLVESVQQIFRHVLRSGLGVTVASFDQDEKQEALDGIEQLVEADNSAFEYLEPIVEWFGTLCDDWPDIIDVSYGGSASDFRDFRVDLVPGLLEALEDWARSTGDSDLATQIRPVLASYKDAIAEVLPTFDEDVIE